MALFGGFAKTMVKRKKDPPQLFRDMEYHQIKTKRAQEADAVVRFYAMLNVIVTFKGRCTYEIEPRVLSLKVKQPLGMSNCE